MIRILGISGSLRAQSFNTALLRLAQAEGGDAAQLTVATLHGVPLYDGDVEQRDGLPEAARALKAQIMAHDALLLATPEYNNGIPGVMKNAIDWLSRPPADIPAVFGDRPVAVLGASPGGFGTILAQNAWLPVLRTLGMRQWHGGKLLVSRAHQVFAADGTVADPALREQVRNFVQGFARFAARSGER